MKMEREFDLSATAVLTSNVLKQSHTHTHTHTALVFLSFIHCYMFRLYSEPSSGLP